MIEGERTFNDPPDLPSKPIRTHGCVSFFFERADQPSSRAGRDMSKRLEDVRLFQETRRQP
jgi:hypothetical protein